MEMKMFVRKLTLLSVSLASLASAGKLKPKILYEDVRAMEALIRTYPVYGSTIPQALMNTIGGCKFLGTVLTNGVVMVVDFF